MSPARSHSLIPWLLLAVVALIAYGSLYPFNLKPDALNAGVLDALRTLSWARAGRGDRIANVLLYLPLGFCLLLWLSMRWRRGTAVLVATALGASLSLCVEVAQVYISSRVPSLTDLALNALGTLLGAGAGLGWDKLRALMHLPQRADKPHRDPAALLLIVTWLVWRFAPFVPHFDLGKLKSALQPLIRPHIDVSTTLVFLAYWLVISQALAALVSRARMLEALLLMMAVVLLGRLIVANQAFVPSELLALILLVPIVVFLYRMAPQPKRLLLPGAMLMTFAYERLAPFTFTGPTPAFDFWPFLVWFDAGPVATLATIDWHHLFGTVFLFAALLWSLRHAGASFRLASGSLIALVCVTEWLQLWLPARDASLTEPAIAVVVVLAFRYTQTRQRHMFGSR